MVIASENDRPAEALVHIREAVERLEQFLRLADPHNPVRLAGFLRPGNPWEAERSGAAMLYVNIALTHVNLSLYDGGALYARRAAELVQAIPSAQDVAGLAMSVLANSLRFQGDLEGALRAIRQARILAEQADYPSPMARMFSLYGVLLREGRILGEKDAVNLDRTAEAMEVLRKALDMLEEAARKDARDSATRSRIGTIALDLGDILRDRDPLQALAVYDLAIKRLGEVPGSLRVRRDRAELLARSSYALRRLRRVSEASARIDAALVILENTNDYPAQRIAPYSSVYVTICAYADHVAETGDLRHALKIYEDLLGAVLASGLKADTRLLDAVSLSRLYTVVADLSRRTGQVDRASLLKTRRLNLWRHWDAKLPNNTFVRRQLAAATGHPFRRIDGRSRPVIRDT